MSVELHNCRAAHGNRLGQCLLIVACALALATGCSTVLTPRQTQTMGTDQLLWYLESGDPIGKGWVAEALGERLLTNRQIDQLLATISSDQSSAVGEKIVDALTGILDKRNDESLNQYVREALLGIVPAIPHAEVCRSALILAFSLSPDAQESFRYALRYMQDNRHGLVRYWCLQYVITNGADSDLDREQVLASIHETLKHETNAAVAELTCRELGRQVYSPALQTMEEISNSGDIRRFESARFSDTEGRKTQADVLAAAIHYAAGIRFATGDLL